VLDASIKMEIVPSSAVLPMLIRDVGKSTNESACVALCNILGTGRPVTYFVLLEPPFATPTLLVWFNLGVKPYEVALA
jgi:hypothetical protein